jgi:hypothetical protein
LNKEFSGGIYEFIFATPGSFFRDFTTTQKHPILYYTKFIDHLIKKENLREPVDEIIYYNSLSWRTYMDNFFMLKLRKNYF